MKIRAYAFITALTLLLNPLYASEKCIKSTLGIINCAPPNGSIMETALGTPVCGIGDCIKTALGMVQCSSVKGGGAMLSSLGQVKCVGGCKPASVDNCVSAR
jgi:hypothetical protein